ncbi:MAG: ATP-binding protein [Pseudomonadota bacterium]
MKKKDVLVHSKLRVAIVGGGRHCQAILQHFDPYSLKKLGIEVVGVADINPQAEGIQTALKRGIHTTSDFRELLSLPDLDLVLELTGNEQVARELSEIRPKRVTILDFKTSRLLHDVVFLGEELKKKKEEINLAHNFTRALAKATSEGVMVLDQNYRIQRINDEACRRAGITEKEALGRFCFQVSHQALSPCISPDTPCPMVETLKTGKSAHAIHEHFNADGNAHYCDVSTYPLVNRKNEIEQVLEIFRDITTDFGGRVESQTRIIKDGLARMVQEDKLIALGKLVASVAHEINNPIGSILNFSKLILKTIQEGPPTKKDLALFEKWLDLTVKEAFRCGRIVTNLLSFARQQGLESKRLDLKELLDQIVILTAHQLELSAIRLESKLPEGKLEIWGDGTQIQECLVNFVFNAIEAMPQGGKLMIRGQANQAKKQIQLEISDTGIGIPPEIMPYIFEPFFTTKKEGQGVGLGLSMVYGIIREHGGDIEVESQPGKGTTFRIILPSSPADPKRR